LLLLLLLLYSFRIAAHLPIPTSPSYIKPASNKMANVHGLYSNKNDDSDDEKDESNNRYVGGIGDHGGGR